MTPFVAEFIGTTLLIVFGNGVVANVLLHKSKGQNSGFLAIALGWAIAVFIGVYTASSFSGAHLNPAVTIADAVHHNDYSKIFTYIPAQFLGAMLGSFLVWIMYKQHFDITEDASLQLACFCNTPALDNKFYNFITEATATFVFMFAVLMLNNSPSSVQIGALNALPVSLIVLGIGLSFGGPTGYAINPARDFAPRLMHFILPIKNKGNSNWNYSLIPVIAPIVGAVLAAVLHKLMM